MLVEPSEQIRVDSWQRLASELNIEYLSTDEVPRRFREASLADVLISACSDMTIVEQARHHPNNDLFKLSMATNWELASQQSGYVQVPVGPACQMENCNPEHRYSLKTERFTWSTFDLVPEGVTWFSTNVNIEHPRVHNIPFGLNNDGPGADLLPEYVGGPRDDRLYVNFQDNSLERYQLKSFYSSSDPQGQWVTQRNRANLPIRSYFEDMRKCRFILCPPGNGMDCYRVWEALYLGCVPILQDSLWARTLQDWKLPVILLKSLFMSQPEFNTVVRYWRANQHLFSLDATRLSYWKKRMKGND